MALVRALARPMLAGMFVYGGLDAVRNPRSKVATAEEVARSMAGALPVDLPEDPEQLVRINGAVQLGAGTLLALGKAPRLAALALAATLVPTTAAAHRFWEVQDEGDRRQQTVQFLKNASMFGGLLLAAVDTAGKPSLVWRAGHASEHAKARAERAALRASRRSRRLAGRAAKRAEAMAAALPNPVH